MSIRINILNQSIIDNNKFEKDQVLIIKKLFTWTIGHLKLSFTKIILCLQKFIGPKNIRDARNHLIKRNR